MGWVMGRRKGEGEMTGRSCVEKLCEVVFVIFFAVVVVDVFFSSVGVTRSVFACSWF